MRRKIMLVALLTLSILLGACQSSATTAPQSGGAEATSTSAPTSAPAVATDVKKPINVAFFVPWTEDAWYVAAVDGAKARAAQLGINLTVYDGGNKVDTQVQQFTTALTQKPDAIVISSVDPASMITHIEKAHDAGIKVIVYDRPIWDTTKIDALLVFDVPGMAKAAGQAAIDYLTKKNGQPKGKVIRVYGDPADSWVTALNQGWDPFMAPFKDVKVIAATSGAWDPATAAANTQQLLVTNSDTDAIVLDSDFLAPGIVTNLQTKGYGMTGQDKHIYVIGSNGNPEALDYIRQGWMDMTFSTPIVDFAGVAVELAANLVDNKPVPDQWTEEGKAWSPATIAPHPNYGGPNFPPEKKAYDGPVLLMLAVTVRPDNVNDPSLWGNMAAKK